MATDDPKEIFVQEWESRRAQGRPSFLRGRVITFLILGVIILLIDWIREGSAFAFGVNEALLSLIGMGAAGWLYGMWVWNRNEKRYEKWKQK